ncbi:MAG TPA: hypothetical protein VF799_07760 [Geobacteraceae bacterium]
MKSLLKITTLWSLLVVACLLAGACGNSASNFVQGQGKITVNVTGSLGVNNLRIDMHRDSTTGSIVDTFITPSTATSPVSHDFEETVGTDYFVTITDLNTPPRYVELVDPNKITPDLINPQTVNETMVQ